MSVNLGKEQAALTKEVGKLKKIFDAIKKFLAKEFLWVLLALIIGLPVALVITYVINNYAPEELKTIVDNYLNGKPTLVGAYALSLVGIYFARTLAGVLKTLGGKKQ